MSFTYPYNQGPDAYVDLLDAAGGAVCFRDQSNNGRVVSYNPGSYRTITSAVIYGAQTGADRDRLMAAYANFLTTGLGLENGGQATPSSGIHLSSNPVRGGSVSFLAGDGFRHVSVLGSDGRVLANLTLAGTDRRSATWYCGDAPAGTYVARLSGKAGIVSRTFVVTR